MSKKNVAAASNTLTFRKAHPKDRYSYGIPGVAGIVVFDTRLFANGKAPKTITLDCDLAAPEEPKKGKGAKADGAAQA
jgi:hypothetical protein